MAISSKSGDLPEGGRTGLDSTDISFKVFKPVSAGNGPSTVRLLYACSNPYGGDKGNRRIAVSAWKTNERGASYETDPTARIYNFASSNNGCSHGGNHLDITIPADHFTFNQSQRYGYSHRTALIVVQKMDIGQAGVKHFRMQAQNSNILVTFDDVSPGEFSGLEYRTYSYPHPGLSAFALHEADPDGPGQSSYRLNFAVDCSYDESKSVFLKWSDADNQPGQPNYDNDIRWRLSGGGKNEERRRTAANPNQGLGGQGFNFTPPGPPMPKTYHNIGSIQHGPRYTWTWDGVNDNNGLQIWMPFSEASAFMTDCPPKGGIGTISCDRIRGWVYFPNDKGFKNFRARIKYNLNPGSENWQDFPNDTGATSKVDEDFKDGNGQSTHPPSAGNQFVVEPEGLSDLLRNRHPGSIEFKLSARNLVTNEVYERLDIKPQSLPCPNERRAACDVTGNQVPGLPANSGRNINVVAGRAFNLNGVFRNTGGVDLYAGPTQKSPNPTDRHNYGLRFHNTGSHRWNKPEWALFASNPNGWVEAGSSRSILINDLMAPSSPGTYIINIEPDHFGWGTAGRPDGGNPFYITACPVTINVYEEYKFTPGASRGGDIENPTTIEYTSTVNQTVPNPHKPIPGTSYYALHRNGVEVDGPHTDGQRNYQGNSSNTRTYTLTSPPQLGDQFCAVTYMKIGAGNTARVGAEAIGYIGPGGVIVAGQDGAASSCYRVKNRPYVKSYGGDVVAGGGFENISCGNTNSQILSYLRPLSEHNPTNNKSGSGSQLAAMALGNISGFTSASLRTTPPQSPKGLTFGHNNDPPASSTMNPLLGGGMSGNGWCVPDFFKSTQFPDSNPNKSTSNSTAAINTTVLQNGRQTVRDINGGKLTLTSSGVYSNRKHTVYVDGDVYIRDNIVYNTNFAGGTASIPNFTLVVRGNIYIQNTVTQLDGLYIAQPDSERANTGRIYTCANSAGNPILVGGEIFNACGASNPTNPPRLTVNGAFVAQRVVLNRSGMTLRDSTFRESATTSKAAEIFNFTPEIYLSPPVFRPDSSPISGDYDYISVLAPTL